MTGSRRDGHEVGWRRRQNEEREALWGGRQKGVRNTKGRETG